jgi:hypothetical protein
MREVELPRNQHHGRTPEDEANSHQIPIVVHLRSHPFCAENASICRSVPEGGGARAPQRLGGANLEHPVGFAVLLWPPA